MKHALAILCLMLFSVACKQRQDSSLSQTQDDPNYTVPLMPQLYPKFSDVKNPVARDEVANAYRKITEKPTVYIEDTTGADLRFMVMEYDTAYLAEPSEYFTPSVVSLMIPSKAMAKSTKMDFGGRSFISDYTSGYYAFFVHDNKTSKNHYLGTLNVLKLGSEVKLRIVTAAENDQDDPNGLYRLQILKLDESNQSSSSKEGRWENVEESGSDT